MNSLGVARASAKIKRAIATVNTAELVPPAAGLMRERRQGNLALLPHFEAQVGEDQVGEDWRSRAPFQSPLLLGWVQGNKGLKLMEDKSISEFGKKVSGFAEGDMSSVALIEAKDWAEKLLDAEFKGRGDKDYLARFRLSEALGIKESYLFRLQYKTEEMKDVAGSVYRALKLAYDDMCARNNAAADRMKVERMELRNRNEIDPKPAAQGLGMDSLDH